MRKGIQPGREALILLATAVLTAPVAGYLLHAWAGGPATTGAGLGAALATVSALGGIWLLAWSFDKPQNVFLAALVGGVLGRMVLFSIALALVVMATEFPPAAFIGGLFAYYVIFQILEIRALHRSAGAATSSPTPEG